MQALLLALVVMGAKVAKILVLLQQEVLVAQQSLLQGLLRGLTLALAVAAAVVGVAVVLFLLVAAVLLLGEVVAVVAVEEIPEEVVALAAHPINLVVVVRVLLEQLLLLELEALENPLPEMAVLAATAEPWVLLEALENLRGLTAEQAGLAVLV